MSMRPSKMLPLIVVLAALAAGGFFVKKTYLDKAPGMNANGAKVAGSERGTSDMPADSKRAADANMPPMENGDTQPGGAVDKPDYSLENDANAKARKDVLSRIDLMPHLTDAQKTKLTSSVDRARGMGCIFIIPFSVGKKTLDAKESDILVNGFKSAAIQKLLEDPTLVFVVLGYADKQGDPTVNEKASIDRAQSVLGVMRDKAGVQNVMYSVGMGGSQMFDGKSATKNRIVEIWAVYP